MWYALLWISSLLFSVLFLTLGLQVAARRERKWQQWTIAAASFLFIFVPSALTLLAMKSIEKAFMTIPRWSADVLAWKIVFIISAFILFHFILLKRRSEKVSLSKPLYRLFCGVIGSGLLTLIIYWRIDVIVSQRISELRTESGAIIYALSSNKIKDSENAAILYQSVFRSIGAYHKLHPEIDVKLKQPIDVLVKDEDVIAGLETLSADLAMLRQSSLLPFCVFNDRIDPTIYYTDFHETMEFQPAVKWLAIDVHRKASQGNYKEAMDNIAAMSRIAAHSSRNHSLHSYLHGLSFLTSAFLTFEDIVSKHLLTTQDIEPIEQIGYHSYQETLQRSLIMEQAIGIAHIASIADNPTSIIDALNDSTGISEELFMSSNTLLRNFYFESEIEKYRNLIETEIFLLSFPYYMEPEINLLSIPYYRSKLHSQVIVNRNFGLFDFLMIEYKQIHQFTAKADAQQKLMRLACAVISYRSANGQYPEKITDVIPQFINYDFLDPFDGQMLRYSRYGKGVILFSIGDNGTEDIDIVANADDKRNSNNIILRIGID